MTAKLGDFLDKTDGQMSVALVHTPAGLLFMVRITSDEKEETERVYVIELDDNDVDGMMASLKAFKDNTARRPANSPEQPV
jgi:hypothetical protein